MQIHLERNFVNIKQLEMTHKTLSTSHKKHLSHQTPAEPQCKCSDKLLEAWLLILQCFAHSFHYLT